MLNRRTFLKTTVVTGTALILNPFSFGKEEPLRWRNTQEEEPKGTQVILIYDKLNDRFLWSSVFSVYSSKGCLDHRGLWRCLSRSYATLSNHDRRTKENLGRCFFKGMRPDHYPEFSYHLLKTKQTFWMPFIEIIKAPLSNNLALIKPKIDVILIHHVPNAPIFIDRKRVEPGYDIFTPCRILGKPQKNPYGKVGIYVNADSKTAKNTSFYLGRNEKYVEWMVLPKV